MIRENYGVHISHCCYIHGCKYGDTSCPVASGEVPQQYICYDCQNEYEPYTLEEIELLRKTKSYRPTYKQLKDKAADLEAKLAEKNLRIEELESQFAYECECNKQFVACQMENDELKQKLAEYECLMKKYNVEDLGHLDIMLFVLSGETKYQLAQLKQQLEEKEKELAELKTENMNIFEYSKEIEQKFAEQDRQIEYFKKQAKRFNNEAQKYFEDAYCNDAIYQDKISFATQTLENLRNEINANGHYFKVDTEFYKYIYETIGEKIKRLKGGV